MDNRGILLDTGTNEVEVLELLIGSEFYGINVLKLRQLVRFDPAALTAIHIPGIHPAIAGTVHFHGTPITVIDLRAYLQVDTESDSGTPRVIAVCEFNGALSGFVVDGFDRIRRISWSDIQMPTLGNGAPPTITGVLPGDDRQVLLLDFEAIISEVVGPALSARQTPATASTEKELRGRRAQTRILFVDDSRTVRKQVETLLRSSGYTSLTICANGGEAYEHVQELVAQASAAGQTGDAVLDVVLTDIEMPQMDGLTLCRRLKSELPGVRVLILSSLISDQMAARCEQVNADAHLSKRDIEQLVDLLDRHGLPEAPAG